MFVYNSKPIFKYELGDNMKKKWKILFVICLLIILITPVYAEEVSKISHPETGCKSIEPVLDYLKTLLNYIRIFALAMAVILQVKDYIQVTFAAKPDDSMKKANGHLVTRMISIGLLFIVPTLVIFGIEAFDTSGLIDASTCGVK